MSLCKCGCGQIVKKGNVWINGHNSRIENTFKGRRHSDSSKLENSLAHRGKKRSTESRIKQSRSVSGCKNHMYGRHVNSNENNGRWKGDSVGYDALHEWVRKNKPKSYVCEMCYIPKPLHAANISGVYLRDINDYLWLCPKCHSEMDCKPITMRDHITGRFVRH